MWSLVLTSLWKLFEDDSVKTFFDQSSLSTKSYQGSEASCCNCCSWCWRGCCCWWWCCCRCCCCWWWCCCCCCRRCCCFYCCWWWCCCSSLRLFCLFLGPTTSFNCFFVWEKRRYTGLPQVMVARSDCCESPGLIPNISLQRPFTQI